MSRVSYVLARQLTRGRGGGSNGGLMLGSKRYCSTAGDLRTGKVRGSRVRQLLTASFMVFACFGVGAIVAWPFLDAMFLPWLMKKAIQCHRPEPNVVHDYNRPRAERLRQLLHERRVVVLNGPEFADKTELGKLLAADRDAIYINCRAFADPAVALYGSLTHVFHDLPYIGPVVIAFYKLFNAVMDIATLNQGHEHTSFIIFTENLGHMRSALWQIHREQRAQGGDERPIVVLDSVEDLVRCDERFPTTALGSIMLNVFASAAAEQGWCDLLIVGDSALFASEQGEAAFEKKFSYVAKHAAFCHVPGTSNTDMSSWSTYCREIGCRPALAAVSLKALEAHGAATVHDIASSTGASPESVAEVLAGLQAKGFIERVVGPPLRDATADDSQPSEYFCVNHGFTWAPAAAPSVQVWAQQRNMCTKVSLPFPVVAESTGVSSMMWFLRRGGYWWKGAAVRCDATVNPAGTPRYEVLSDASQLIALKNGTTLVSTW